MLITVNGAEYQISLIKLRNCLAMHKLTKNAIEIF